MGSLVIGLPAGPLCLRGVSSLKRMTKADDVFGVSGVSGIADAILTGVFCAEGLGGIEPEGFSMARQVGVQIKSMFVTLVRRGGRGLLRHLQGRGRSARQRGVRARGAGHCLAWRGGL